MPRYNVTLEILVDAKNSNAAFAAARDHYCVVNDPARIVTPTTLAAIPPEGAVDPTLVDLFVSDCQQVEDDATMDDFA